MKKVLSIVLSFIIFSSCFIFLFSCTPTQEKEKFEVDLSGYVANISDATAIGLVNQSIGEMASLSSCETTKISLGLSAYAEDNEGNGDQNFLVMSTTYSANDPETDESGLTKVSFTKIVTGTEKISGHKYVYAHNSSICIASHEGFTYSVFLNDELIIGNITDNDSNDQNSKNGVITINGLTTGKKYRVEYEGLGEEITITQDEIEAEINHLCITKDYTFVQYVPKGRAEPRSYDQIDGYIQSHGVSKDDPLYESSRQYWIQKINKGEVELLDCYTASYSTSDTSQSFVIDNLTGYVYPIENKLPDFDIKNNLLFKDSLEYDVDLQIERYSRTVYDMTIGDDNSLQIQPIATNENLGYHAEMNAFKDKYNNIYIEGNPSISYKTDNVYYISKLSDGEHYRFLNSNYELIDLEYEIYRSQDNFKIIVKTFGNDGQSKSLETTSDFLVNEWMSQWIDYTLYFYQVSDGYAYFYSHNTKCFIRYDIAQNVTQIKRFDYAPIVMTDVDYNHILFFTGTPENSGDVYFAQVWSDLDTENQNMFIINEDELLNYINTPSSIKPQLLAMNAFGENIKKVNNEGIEYTRYSMYDTYNYWRFSVQEGNTKIYYRLNYENGIMTPVKESEYTPKEKDSITLYPLNAPSN